MTRQIRHMEVQRVCGHTSRVEENCITLGQRKTMARTPCVKCLAFVVRGSATSDLLLGLITGDGAFTLDRERSLATDGRCTVAAQPDRSLIVTIPKGYIHSIAVRRGERLNILYNATEALKR